MVLGCSISPDDDLESLVSGASETGIRVWVVADLQKGLSEFIFGEVVEVEDIAAGMCDKFFLVASIAECAGYGKSREFLFLLFVFLILTLHDKCSQLPDHITVSAVPDLLQDSRQWQVFDLLNEVFKY